jgi:hypothetical protein
MGKKVAVLVLLTASVAFASSTIDVRLGFTQYYRKDIHDPSQGSFINERGYKGDIVYEMAFRDWDIELDLRAMGYPGPANIFAGSADVGAAFYFTDAPIRIFIAPAIGFSHYEIRLNAIFPYWDRAKNDFFRFGCGFGFKAVKGAKYLAVSYTVTSEFPTGETTDYGNDYLYYVREVNDFYLEQTVGAEFGWGFARHFGFGAAIGVTHGNYATAKAPYLGPGYHDGLASKYVPYVQFGPSIYF